jgi:dTDP-L-rhamnose 4-epimerase
VLLTGAAGFIGSRVDAALRAAGHEVVAVDIMLPAAHGDDPALPPNCQRVDVRNADALASLLAGVDLVCHQAAVVGAGVDAADAPIFGSHNDYGTAVLLAQMFDTGVRRLVLASSMVVYGQGLYRCVEHGPVDPLPRRRADLVAGTYEHRCPVGGEELVWQLVDEDAPLRPRSLYAASKTAQEHYALAWSESTGGSVVALRYHNVYGPGMPRDTPYSGVAAIFRSALEKGQPPPVFEDGGQMRDFVHVDDVAAANLAAASPRPMSVLGGRFPSWRWRRHCVQRGIPLCRRLSPASIAAAMCATSSPIRLGPPTCWVSGRPSIRGTDCATSHPPRCAVSAGW